MRVFFLTYYDNDDDGVRAIICHCVKLYIFYRSRYWCVWIGSDYPMNIIMFPLMSEDVNRYSSTYMDLSIDLSTSFLDAKRVGISNMMRNETTSLSLIQFNPSSKETLLQTTNSLP